VSAGHIRPRGPGAWELKYDLGADPITGKRRVRYKTVHGKKSDAQRELRDLLGAVDKGVVSDAGKMTVGGWLKQWLEEARHHVSPKTHERYSEIVNRHLVPALGAIQLTKLAPVHIQSYYSDALKSGRLDGKGGLSAQTVVHFDRVLSKALKRARKLRLISVNPAEDVERPKVEDREMQTLSDDQAAQLLAAAATTRLYVPIVLTLATGLRRGELLALRWQDINLATGTVEVVRSLEQTNDGLRFKTPRRNAASARSCCRPA
jgi:integrase